MLNTGSGGGPGKGREWGCLPVVLDRSSPDCVRTGDVPSMGLLYLESIKLSVPSKDGPYDAIPTSYDLGGTGGPDLRNDADCDRLEACECVLDPDEYLLCGVGTAEDDIRAFGIGE